MTEAKPKAINAQRREQYAQMVESDPIQTGAVPNSLDGLAGTPT